MTPFAQSARSTLLKAAPLLAGTTILRADYRVHQPDGRTVVYCDPPYRGTTGYPGTPPFDSDEFWTVAAEWSRRGAMVLVSEYVAPGDWRLIAETQKFSTVAGQSEAKTPRTERLFVHKSRIDEIDS
jgi:DNA adenine methylase